MFKWKLLTILFVFLKFHDYKGCGPEKKTSDSPKQYDLNEPLKMVLPNDLNEISGLSYYKKDSSVFAIIDEDGLLFKISLNGSGAIKKWRFDKKHDFEDVVLHDSTFYVLISNGDIESLKFTRDSIVKTKSRFPDADKHSNEFETLYYDDSAGLMMMCKKCEDDKRKIVTALNYKPDSLAYIPGFTIDADAVAKIVKDDKLRFKPSAAAVNPLTNELYILASVNKLLIVTDRKGTVKNVYPLDPVTFNQPEGITFTPWGDMIISNERGDEENATILIFKPQKGTN